MEDLLVHLEVVDEPQAADDSQLFQLAGYRAELHLKMTAAHNARVGSP